MKFNIVIPARYASTRLPGKPLLDIAGKPMIQHVYERAQESGAAQVIIATDDANVAEVATGFGADVCMTADSHNSGTERLAEVAEKQSWGSDEIIVNLQGDEPLMPPAIIQQVARNLHDHPNADMATLCERIRTTGELFDPHVVKVVMDSQGYAIYFSRAPIPWDRDAFAVTTEVLPERTQHFRHIGMYAYRAQFIQRYVKWPASAIEEMEALEQLRVLWHGGKIHIAEAQTTVTAGVDTEDDLLRVRQMLQ